MPESLVRYLPQIEAYEKKLQRQENGTQAVVTSCADWDRQMFKGQISSYVIGAFEVPLTQKVSD